MSCHVAGKLDDNQGLIPFEPRYFPGMNRSRQPRVAPAAVSSVPIIGGKVLPETIAITNIGVKRSGRIRDIAKKAKGLHGQAAVIQESSPLSQKVAQKVNAIVAIAPNVIICNAKTVLKCFLLTVVIYG